MQYPITMNHIGISVHSIDKAISFYKEVFGWYHVSGPFELKRDGSASSLYCDSIFQQDWTSVKMAHMSTGDRIGFELFEFEGNYPPNDIFEIKRQGLFHFSITVPNIEEFLEKLLTHGGKQRSPISKREVNGNIYGIVYAQDPFDNVFEIYTHGYEMMQMSQTIQMMKMMQSKE
jgi:catechol 2,3-dioxygenase-like lactoylglutathione lyase family enzyme